MTVTFFGHSNAPQNIQPILEKQIIDLIENNDADNFYVGNHGNFDTMVRKTLRKVKLTYPHIEYAVVLAYLPGKIKELEIVDYSDTIYPDGIENTPPKYAIDKRNRWMLEQADIVITYVKYIVGGAQKFNALAEKKGKTVINIAADEM